MIKTYVEFVFPAFPKDEYCDEEVTSRNHDLVKVPEGAIGYRFFDRMELFIHEEKLVGDKRNISPMVYLGKEYTVEEVSSMFPECVALIGNMRRKGWTRVVLTREGTWRPLFEGDTVIS